MRIIAGSAKRRIILSPKGRNTRPTQDYIREALFNVLQGYIEGSKCLDLFAGSGALGLEALSRGASLCIYGDKDYNAYNTIKSNIDSLRFNDRAILLKADWHTTLEYIYNNNIKLDVVFLDPPYSFNNCSEIFIDLNKKQVLNNDALIVLERDKTQELLNITNYTHVTRKNYGITLIDIYKYEGKYE